MAESYDFTRILVTLHRHEVEFIVVGGVAAALAGSPAVTFDVDIVYQLTGDNVERLDRALGEMKARYKDPAGRDIRPDTSKLETMKVHRLLTEHGDLDVLATAGADQTYADLVDRTREYEIEGRRLLVLNLEALIETKRQAGRPKDLHGLLFLEQLKAIKLERGEE